jgi:pimeloyl-ACP methyl ester carboxylesterase
MATRIIATNTVELCVDASGDRADPTVLLVAGEGTSMASWHRRLCRRLVAAGRHVVRYDHRDVGRSTRYPAGRPPYTLEHLADDAVAVLDGTGVDAAHLVGASMGGMVAQLAALRHPARVATVTAIASAADPRALAAAAGNHGVALAATPAWRDRLGELEVPTLVVHGTDDTILPLGHGAALARAVPGARLHVVAGLGHDLPPRCWETVLPLLLAHTSHRHGGSVPVLRTSSRHF